ncbi:hypothetical protein ASPWEDRAFT_62807 [Aspergillus wentii DTO 134E9]|uniref:AB hydrolase-1 domain-containing protein n=1 Tax=Aspergillus wentii DTO 134E9 TaxID=1073089 RepID=A0A1L9R5F7_ASPWE|nr:uncharacterized protein ASPWEDRAFT_62807 [Aspergillus wentii DTO 134E9]KAI9925362.1 hypothetical protein MW887_006290 [Aspergillus wentii]OJJ30142.1 hypothetical protein ASPWEDRAFT_62807 [Aspergillus wentii DTO 134E9]
MSEKPTIVLVPGAWSKPFFYEKLQSSLADRGFQSETHAHPSIGAEPPTKTLDDDVSALRGVIARLCDAGKRIVVVAHSYGGIVSSSAVEGLGKEERNSEGKIGGVIEIIYMVAFVVPKGQSLISASGGQLLPWIKTEGNYASCTIGPEGAFHDLLKADREKWNAALTHTSLPVFSGISSYEPWKTIPTTYVLGEEDQMLPLAIQEYMVQMLGTKHTYRLKSSHHPFLSMPDTVAEIIEESSVRQNRNV